MAGVLGGAFLLSGQGHGPSSSVVLALAAASVPLVAVGVADDLRPVAVSVRLVIQLLAGGILYAWGLHVTNLTNPFGDTLELGALGFVLTVVWVVTVINAMNLMDGLDGLAAGTGGIAALVLAAVGGLKGERDLVLLGLLLAGAMAGFLPYNFPRARVFLGDAGSTFIGLVLAAASLVENRKTTASMTLLLPLVALGLPLLDAAVAVVRRTASGRNPMRRDLGHLHHRLLRLGLSGPLATACLLGVSSLFGLAALWIASLPKQSALALTVVLGTLTLAALVLLRRYERVRPGGEV